MSRHLKIAAAQLGPLHRSDTRASAVKRLTALLREAHGMGARFVVFPELALTTFFPRWWMEDQAEVDARYFERTIPSKETQPLFDEAKRLGIGFYLGYAELTPEKRRYNTAILVGPDGAIVGKYRKVHLPGHDDHKPKAPFQHLEKKYFEVGDLGFRVWRFLDTITGMLICNDRRWPEAFRVLALQGAEIVALGYNTPTENLHYPEPPALRVHHHLIMAQAMAYQNATWLVEAAKCGFEDGFRMFGHSLIVAPTGEIAVKSQTEEDEVICYDCDVDLAANLKNTMFNFAAHRRPEHYRLIVERVDHAGAHAQHAELEHEAETTRRVLERIPAEHLSWRPHRKSMSLGQLAMHIASIPGNLSRLAQLDEFDASQANFAPPTPGTLEEIITTHEASIESAQDYFSSVDEQILRGSWRLTANGREVFMVPKSGLIRSIMLNHLYHHRGQLSVYLRLLEVPVPVIYGRSADENPRGPRFAQVLPHALHRRSELAVAVD